MLAQPEWDASHTEFQRECLVDLEPALHRLGIRLITRRGEAVAILDGLRNETGFRLLVAHEETGTGVTYQRDRRVRQWARAAGVEFCELPQTGVVRRLASRNGWNRLWEQRMTAPAATVPRCTGRGGLETIERLDSAGILRCRDLGLPPDPRDRQRGGEQTAAEVLDDFLGRRGRHYSGGISSPLSAAASCSRLSPHLAFGALSMRRVWQASEARRLDVTATLATASEPRARAELKAWQRSLKAVQSRLHWHCHFMQKLEDEPAIEQDPRGIFIRRWLPELAGVPVAYIHMPWTMPADVQQAAGCVIGREYPAAIVDHAAAVREAKRRLAPVRNAPSARAEARAVAHRHGSRKDRRGALQQDPVRRRLARDADSAAPVRASATRDRQQRLPFCDDADTCDQPGQLP